MTDNQALLASMENNTLIIIFIGIVTAFLVLLYKERNNKPKKCIVDLEDLKEFNLSKDELVQILMRFSKSATLLYRLRSWYTPTQIQHIIKEWVNDRILNDKTKN